MVVLTADVFQLFIKYCCKYFTSVSTIEPACIGPHIVEKSKKNVPTKNESNIKADDRVSTNTGVLCLERQKVTFCYEYSVRLMYLPVIE